MQSNNSLLREENQEDIQEDIIDTPAAPGISRRAFVAWSSLLVGATAISGAALTGCAPRSPEPDLGTFEPFDYDKVVWSGCHVNCGSRCPLKAYVKDGTVVRIGIDDEGSDDFGPGEIYQMRSCVRGRTNRQRIYNETRIQTPLRRVAGTKRGEGQYEEISWDEAIEEITSTMKGIKDEYGNDAFYIQYGTGDLGGSVAKSWHPDNSAFARLMNLWGGYLRHYCDYSTGQITWELPLLNGDAWSNNEVMDLVNSKNIVLFGNNPANTRMSGSAMCYLISQVRQQNPDVNIVDVDPMLSDTVIGVSTRWVPIRPGTDMALIAGMIHHLHTTNKLDSSYVRENCIGFYSDTFLEDVKSMEPKDAAFMGFDPSGGLTIDEDMSYEAYLMGTGAYAGTGVKTAEWASAITGTSAKDIRELAELYVNGPTATIQGWGPQRHSNGGNNTRAIGLIAAITKNIGISGGGTGARESIGGVPFQVATALPNFADKNNVDVQVSFFNWYQAIENYRSMTDTTWGVRWIGREHDFASTPGEIRLRAPIKFIWSYASNVFMGQHADINEMLRIYNLPDTADSGLRMIVTVDCYLTPSALVSDIILPGTTPFEEDDLITGGSAWTGYVCCETRAIEPLYEAKSVYDICTLISQGLGIEQQFTEGRTQLDWVEWFYQQGLQAGESLPSTFEEFRALGLIKKTDDHTPSIAAHDSINTPSGKYEVFSKQAYNLSQQWDLTGSGYIPDDGLDKITGLPIYYESYESFGDTAAKADYPFQIIGHHTKSRTHSSYGNVAWLKSIVPQQLWINTQDAAELGIENDDEVLVWNHRGKTRISAKVTPRIMPGVVSLPQGAWYKPERREASTLGSVDVVDTGGCVAILTSIRPTPLSKGNGCHSTLCQIAKA